MVGAENAARLQLYRWVYELLHIARCTLHSPPAADDEIQDTESRPAEPSRPHLHLRTFRKRVLKVGATPTATPAISRSISPYRRWRRGNGCGHTSNSCAGRRCLTYETAPVTLHDLGLKAEPACGIDRPRTAQFSPNRLKNRLAYGFQGQSLTARTDPTGHPVPIPSKYPLPSLRPNPDEYS